MADEDTKIVDGGQTDGGETNDGQDGGGEDVKPQTESEFMDDTVKFIKEAQKATVGDNDDAGSDGGSYNSGGGSSGDESGRLADLAGTDIPDAFSEAAEAAGMSPADIIAFADKHSDEELIELIPHLKAALEEPEKKEPEKKEEEPKEGEEENKDAELEARIAERIQKQLEEKFGTSLDEIEKFKAHQEEQSMKNTVDKASKLLDEASKEFPVFGKTDELPRFTSGRLAGQLIPTSPEMKARLEVLRYADAFMGGGADIDDAMGKALATYKGLHLEVETQRKVIRDLKNHESKLSGARTGKETKKKFVDSRDEIIDEIRQMQRAAGIE